jgi:hypothetical protein
MSHGSFKGPVCHSAAAAYHTSCCWDLTAGTSTVLQVSPRHPASSALAHAPLPAMTAATHLIQQSCNISCWHQQLQLQHTTSHLQTPNADTSTQQHYSLWVATDSTMGDSKRPSANCAELHSKDAPMQKCKLCCLVAPCPNFTHHCETACLQHQSPALALLKATKPSTWAVP